MPIYEYRCRSCGHIFELWQRITDPPAKICEKCHKKSAVRCISATSFLLKGGGWYADGYSSRGAGKKGGNSSSGGSAKETTNKSTDRAAGAQ